MMRPEQRLTFVGELLRQELDHEFHHASLGGDYGSARERSLASIGRVSLPVQIDDPINQQSCSLARCQGETGARAHGGSFERPAQPLCTYGEVKYAPGQGISWDTDALVTERIHDDFPALSFRA